MPGLENTVGLTARNPPLSLLASMALRPNRVHPVEHTSFGSDRVMRSEAIARELASLWRMAFEVTPRRRGPSGRVLIFIGLMAAMPFVFPAMLQKFVDQLLY